MIIRQRLLSLAHHGHIGDLLQFGPESPDQLVHEGIVIAELLLLELLAPDE